MRKLPLVVALLLLLLPASVFADVPSCNGALVYSGAYRASVLDVAVEGANLWAATSHGVTLYDTLSDPPRAVTSVALPGTTNRIRLASGFAYAGSGSKLFVLRQNGERIEIVTSVDMGGTINDLLLVGNFMYVATSSGIVQVDLLVPSSPAIGPKLNTGTGRALSLARFETTLFAADGDASVEMYSIQVPSIPQRTGSFTGLPQSTSVHVTGLNILVSDGQQTQLFTVGNPPVKVGSPIAMPTTALYRYDGSIVFAAGNTRTLRAIDLSSTPSVLFSEDLPLSGGSINRISGITGQGGRVYVAAGDAGLATFDVTSFRSPFPMRAIAAAELTSIARTTNGIVVTPAEGGLRFYSVATDSDLPLAGTSWEGGKVWTLRDVQGVTIVATAARTLSVWNVSFGNAVLMSSATFPETLTGAVLVGTRIYALTETETTRTLWQGDISETTWTPAKLVAAGVTAPAIIARNGTAVAIAEFTDAGKTILSYWSEGNPALPAERVEVDGAATSGVALSAGGRAAVATFKGISIIQFPSKSVTLVPGIPPGRDIAFDGERLLFATDMEIRQYDGTTGTQVATWRMPAMVTQLQIGPATGNIFFALTDEQIVSIRPAASASVPRALDVPATNRYYTHIALGGRHLVLADRSRVDSFRTREDGRPSYAGSFSLPFTPLAIAADNQHVYALSVSGRLSAFGYDGVERKSVIFNEGSDATFSQLRFVGGALHVALLRGCSSGSCEKKTVVIDAVSLVQTASYGGAIVDAVVAGTTAWIITDSPNELRRLDITDPLHPIVSASRELTSSNPLQKAVAIGRSASFNAIYVLGTKLNAYDATTLAPRGELLDPYTEDPARRLTYLDQDLIVEDSCVTLLGRNFAPQVGTLSSATVLTGVTSLEVPAAAKRVVTDGDVTYILTDYSLEVYSQKLPPQRRRPSRR